MSFVFTAKAAFCDVKDHLLQRKRPPLAPQYVAFCGEKCVCRPAGFPVSAIPADIFRADILLAEALYW